MAVRLRPARLFTMLPRPSIAGMVSPLSQAEVSEHRFDAPNVKRLGILRPIDPKEHPAL